jgi:hypothetical protein
MVLVAKKPLPTYRNWKIMIPVALVIVLLVILALELTNTTHIFHKRSSVQEPFLPTASQETKGEPTTITQPSDKQQTSNSPATSPGDNKGTPAVTTSLVTPSGNLVSNHRASLSSSQSSTCTTSAGASCQIIFIKDSVTKSLTAQITDRAGTAYWTWTPQYVGLSSGTWTIQATATLSGQTKTTMDALTLELSP